MKESGRAAAPGGTPGYRAESSGRAREHLREALVGRYDLERELGRGGMATVYLAHDLRHDRPVALKVLHPELAHALGPERFLQEIRTAARLQHPHILSVYDSGDAAGCLWFTMPYVEGETLRDRLCRECQLPLEDALRITTEAARALDYAHRHGVVHRDVKPENLLLTRDGDTLVADFGIGRALGAPAPDERLTDTGLVVGTPAYMSPEQAAGGEVDGRSDVYSLGCVLYEMLAGEPPFTGPTPQAVLARRLSGAARPLRPLRETVPEALEQAVAKALAQSAADRFQMAAEFARALTTPARTPASPAAAPQVTTPAAPSRVITGGARTRVPPGRVAAPAFLLGLLVMASTGMFVWERTHRALKGAGEAPERIAVLPFENLGGSAEEPFAGGITDEVRGKLAALPDLQVVARSSSGRYRHTAKSPQQIGKELGVEYLLTGTVSWEKDTGGQSQVRVSPELVQVATGSTSWQAPFEAPLTDVFQIQGEIAGRVAHALEAVLTSGERARQGERPAEALVSGGHPRSEASSD